MKGKSRDIPEDKAIIVHPGKGERLNAKGISCTFKLPSTHTNDQLGVYEIVLPSQTTGAGLHYHRFMDETFIVMKGMLTILLAGTEKEVAEGGVVHIPRFTPHGFANRSRQEVKIMLVFNPGQRREGYFYGLFENLRAEVADVEELTLINERFDTVPIK